MVEHGTVTRAAEEIYVAQPALSQSLRALETELGVELFHRVPRGMELTAAGHALVDPARQVMLTSDRAEREVSRITSLEGGWLNVVSRSDLAVDPLTTLIGRYREQYPRVLVNLMQPHRSGTVEDFLRGAECEVGIAYLPSEGANLESVRLGRKCLVLGLPPHLADLAVSPFALGGLDGLPLVMGPQSGAVRQDVESACAELGFTPTVVVDVEHEYDVFQLIGAGAGAGFIAEADIDRASLAGVRIVRTEPELGREYGVVFRAGPLSPAAAAFVAVAADYAGVDWQAPA